MTDQVYSLIIFIGREQEMAVFEQMLDRPEEAQWILNIHGPGGIGKTQLLRRFVEMAAERRASGSNVLVTNDLIDLYWTAHQRELGILKSIASQLSPTQFRPFYTALNRYEELLAQAESPDPALVYERANKARDQFFEVYKGLTTDWIVLLFDTAEVASSAIIRFWQDTLPKFRETHHKTVAVIAGRQPVTALPAAAVKLLQVTGFSPEDVGKYFEQQQIEAPPDFVTRVAELSRGRPILVALTVDWLNSGNTPQDLIAYPPDQFERAMVERILQLRFPEDRAILAMAHFYRRFDEQVLAYMLDLATEEAVELIQSLSRFSFIKYRAPVEGKVGSCLLHDEMRAFINQYVWPSLDPLGEYRRDRNRKIVTYYAGKIEAERDLVERQHLSQEHLFYWLDADLTAAFAYSHELFERAMNTFDTDQMEAINTELLRVKDKLLPPMLREFKFRQAVVLYRRERYPEAVQEMQTLLADPTCEPILRASAQARLMEFYADSGQPQQAIELGLQGEQWFEDLLQQIPTQRKVVERDFGMLCNNLGYAYWRLGKLHATINYYNKALDHFAAAGSAYSQIARTKNNLGFVYHRLGRDDEALAECETALKIRQRLNLSYELGLSYNVLGMIYVDQLRVHEAISYFEQALRAFEEAKSERGQALAYLAYGRLMRQWGWYKEKFAGEPHNPEREEYRQAGDMLDQAIKTFREVNDRTNLLEALNEMGTLRRQQRRWAEAIKHFNESAELARQIGNRYREVDNLQDIGIAYYFAGQSDQALVYAQQASDIAKEIEAYHLFARAQRTVANVIFAYGDYDRAFEAAANACVYIPQLDPETISASPAKRELIFNEVVGWAGEMILKLPSHELAQAKAEYLIQRWEETGSGGQRLVDLYPGFITRMRALARDYPLLAQAQGG